MHHAQPFTLTRRFAAPVDLLYAAHTEPERLARWMSPAGFRVIHADMDLRVGGRYHYGLEGPGGVQMWGLQQFRELQPGLRLDLLQSFSDREGQITRHPMAPLWPLKMRVRLNFSGTDLSPPGDSELQLSWQPFEATEAEELAFGAARASMALGFAGTFAQLDAYLAEQTR